MTEPAGAGRPAWHQCWKWPGWSLPTATANAQLGVDPTCICSISSTPAGPHCGVGTVLDMIFYHVHTQAQFHILRVGYIMRQLTVDTAHLGHRAFKSADRAVIWSLESGVSLTCTDMSASSLRMLGQGLLQKY